MFDKLKYALSLFTSNEMLVLLLVVLVYHGVILITIYLSVRGSVSFRIRELEADLNEYRTNWENRDKSWKDREDELRRILHIEKDREVSQLKGEYDSYVNLLEQKLARARTREG